MAVSITCRSSTCTTKKPAASAVRTARSISAPSIPARLAQSLIRRNLPDRPRVAAYRTATKRAASSKGPGERTVAVKVNYPSLLRLPRRRSVRKVDRCDYTSSRQEQHDCDGNDDELLCEEHGSRLNPHPQLSQGIGIAEHAVAVSLVTGTSHMATSIGP